MLSLLFFNGRAQKRFVHPGVLHSLASFETMREVVQRKNVPGYSAYLLMAGHPCASAFYQLRGPFEFIARDGEFKYTKGEMEMDFSAAYLNAIMWMITKDQAHARKSIEILESYADSLKGIPVSNDAALLAGLEGSKIVNAIEILSHSESGLKKFQVDKINKMIKCIFLPVCDRFYSSRAYTNGNWGAIVTRMYIGAAVYFDDEKMYRSAVEFYINGNDNGTIKNYVSENGQIQESGRDQGHAQLGLGAMASICEISWNQGQDLYKIFNNRLLNGFEYVAKYNLGEDHVPFVRWKDITGKYSNWTEISAIGRGKFIPIYEMVYNHYVGLKGLSMPFTRKVLERTRPEGYDRDQPAFGTLLFKYATYK
ncbi:alginate lyase family protein [Pedobacter sp. MC2016-24]|uniref:alginate lyase family protein n=1 Tax=Pedobacter sp. MC2016-24 TaxID=2780090 RepID=UPI00187E7039|nr:alginate lyase family protein [Pedobacter sp. MC2016-24]MBE9599817.1 alginate lyase family protein [Pedobacter sp. MC2016-24]